MSVGLNKINQILFHCSSSTATSLKDVVAKLRDCLRVNKSIKGSDCYKIYQIKDFEDIGNQETENSSKKMLAFILIDLEKKREMRGFEYQTMSCLYDKPNEDFKNNFFLIHHSVLSRKDTLFLTMKNTFYLKEDSELNKLEEFLN